MGGCFSRQRRRSRYKQETKRPEAKEKDAEEPPAADSGDRPAAPTSPPPPPPAAVGPREAWSSDQPAGSPVPLPECAPEAALALDALEPRLAALRELQGQYLRGQLRVRRLCQLFPRALRATSLQLCHARRRLIRVEVRLKRREGPGALPASTLTHDEPILPMVVASTSRLSAGSSLSSFSLPRHPFPAPPPPPPLRPDLGDLKEALEALLELQAHHLQDRKRDLRGCQECLKSVKALRAQLRNIRNRLWVLEAKLGIQVPPRELDVDEREEEEKEEPEIPPGALDTSGEEPEEMSENMRLGRAA